MKFQLGHTTNIRHGHSVGRPSPEYQCWTDMKSRCLNRRSKFFKYYGGRGIKICARWLKSFENFLADVGVRPSPKHTIDRFPNNDGDYRPGNVRWATRQQQIDNRRATRMVNLNGTKISITQACRILGVRRKMVSSRIDRGWTPEKAVTTPAFWTRPDIIGRRRNK